MALPHPVVAAGIRVQYHAESSTVTGVLPDGSRILLCGAFAAFTPKASHSLGGEILAFTIQVSAGLLGLSGAGCGMGTLVVV
jgi:hypothetical protein